MFIYLLFFFFLVATYLASCQPTYLNTYLPTSLSIYLPTCLATYLPYCLTNFMLIYFITFLLACLLFFLLAPFFPSFLTYLIFILAPSGPPSQKKGGGDRQGRPSPTFCLSNICIFGIFYQHSVGYHGTPSNTIIIIIDY